MGLFDWFRRRRRPSITLWLDTASQVSGFVARVQADVGSGQAVLVVAHFKEQLVAFGRALAEAGIEFALRRTWSQQDTKQLCSGQAGVTAVLAAALPDLPEGSAQSDLRSQGACVSLHVVDMHILDEENQSVERFAASLPVPTQMAVSLSFDDPVMAVFAKPWVQVMMVRMGLTAGEPIQSPMVDKGLRNALRKLAKKATGNVPCDSSSEWLRRNLPQ